MGLPNHTLIFFHWGRAYKWNQIMYGNYTDVFMNRDSIFFQNKLAISTIWSLWFQKSIIILLLLLFFKFLKQILELKSRWRFRQCFWKASCHVTNLPQSVFLYIFYHVGNIYSVPKIGPVGMQRSIRYSRSLEKSSIGERNRHDEVAECRMK